MLGPQACASLKECSITHPALWVERNRSRKYGGVSSTEVFSFSPSGWKWKWRAAGGGRSGLPQRGDAPALSYLRLFTQEYREATLPLLRAM